VVNKSYSTFADISHTQPRDGLVTTAVSVEVAQISYPVYRSKVLTYSITTKSNTFLVFFDCLVFSRYRMF